MTLYPLDEFDGLPADQRFPTFLLQELGYKYDQRAEALALACGYKRREIVDQWIAGQSAIPLKVVPQIASFFGRDIARVLPLWIAAHAGGEDQDVLWQASKRMLTTWEMGLIHTARDIYGGDEDDES